MKRLSTIVPSLLVAAAVLGAQAPDGNAVLRGAGVDVPREAPWRPSTPA